MLVKQLAGRQAGEIIEMPMSLALPLIAAERVLRVRDSDDPTNYAEPQGAVSEQAEKPTAPVAPTVPQTVVPRAKHGGKKWQR